MGSRHGPIAVVARATSFAPEGVYSRDMGRGNSREGGGGAPYARCGGGVAPYARCPPGRQDEWQRAAREARALRTTTATPGKRGWGSAACGANNPLAPPAPCRRRAAARTRRRRTAGTAAGVATGGGAGASRL
jgi:hypothetical protein